MHVLGALLGLHAGDRITVRNLRLGLANTHYVNSSGQVTPGHYTSARDLAELGRVAMGNAGFRDLTWRVHATVKWRPDRALSAAAGLAWGRSAARLSRP
jgi:D-alanyl-D-alanine carboxypeptidase